MTELMAQEKPATTEAWIERLSEIGRLSAIQRVELAEWCRQSGGHVPSGEYFATQPPTHVCWKCADLFHD